MVAMRAYSHGRDMDSIKRIRRVLLGEDFPEEKTERFDLNLWASVIPNAEIGALTNEEGDVFIITQINDNMRERGEEPWRTLAVRQEDEDALDELILPPRHSAISRAIIPE